MLSNAEDGLLGFVTRTAAEGAVKKITDGKKKKPQSRYSDEIRYTIAKYANEHGATSAERKFKKDFPTIRESSIRSWLKKYRKERALAAKEKRQQRQVITLELQGRPVMLRGIDEQVRSYLMSFSQKGGRVSYVIAIELAKVLISESKDPAHEHLKHVIPGESWAQSILRRMGFRRRAATTGKVHISEGAKKEAGILFHHEIASVTEKYNIPPKLVINSDQTPSKYVTAGRTTMAAKNASTVPLVGSSDKRAITLTLSVALDGTILPFQCIYGGKTTRSIPNVDFPSGFCLSANDKHYSNTDEVLKHLKEVIVPYVETQRKDLNLPEQKALLIWDVFRAQLTPAVKACLQDNNIVSRYVPKNMTDLYQPLDRTVNKWVKDFMKREFCNWFSKQLREQISNQIPLDEIDIKLQLSVMKPLHAGWMIKCYNELTTIRGKEVILSGWRATGLTEAINNGPSSVPLDPFADIDQLEYNDSDMESDDEVVGSAEEYVDLDRKFDDSDSEWEYREIDIVIQE